MAPRPPEYTQAQRTLLDKVVEVHKAKTKADAEAAKLDTQEMLVAERAMANGVQVGDVGDALGMTRSGFLSRRKRADTQRPAPKRKSTKK
jgi:hypothetical protein